MAEYFYTKGGERQGPVTRDALRDLVDRGDVTSTDYFWFAGMEEWAVIGDGALPHAAVETAPTSASPFGEVSTQESSAPVDTAAASPAAVDRTTTEQTPNPYTPTATTAATAAASPVAAPSPVQSTFGSGSVTSGPQGDLVGVKEIALKLPSPLWLALPAVVFILMGILYGITIFGLIIAWIPIWLGVVLFQANKALEAARVSGYRNDLMLAAEKLTMYFRINGVLFIIGIVLTVVSLIFTLAVGSSVFNDLSNL